MPSAIPSRHVATRTLFVVGLTTLCIWVLWRFIPSLVWALVIAIATWPLRERLVRSGLSPVATAVILTFALAILAISPFVLFGAEMARDAQAIAEVIREARHGELRAPTWLSELPVVGIYATDWWHAHFGTPKTPDGLLAQSQSAAAFQRAREVAQWVIRRLIVFGFTLLSLLFLYKEGSKLAVDVERLGLKVFGAPATRYGRYSISAVQGTVNGLVFVAIGEGLLLAIGYILFGVSHPMLFGAATAVLAIIPFGAPVVLALASLTLVATSRLVAASLLFTIGALVIAVVDHTARPALIGGSIRLPFFWALLGVFGGLEAFGIVGLFVGPAIMAVAITIWREALQATDPLGTA